MSLIDLVMQHVGTPALEKIAARLDLSPAMVERAAQALLPALAGGLMKHAQAGSLPAAPPAGTPPGSDEAQAHGNDVLGAVLGSREASRSLAQEASTQTGINVDTLKKLLPQFASLAAKATSNAHAQGGIGGLASRLGGLL
ncbi:DUF937 domain-containing protein [Frateuria sp. GZRR33]|uniref:DUF937 domain-containing protein n=1 Tax=Frateuria sp. GZRR33 TaxID=3351535 RepID=UPI003EDCA9F9